MKNLRYFLTFTVVVDFILGLALLLFAKQFTSSQGTHLAAAGLVFARDMGGLIIAIGVLNWFARKQQDIRLLKGVIVTNLVVYVLTITVDALGAIQGSLKASYEWLNIIFRLMITLVFVYFLFHIRGQSPNQEPRNKNKRTLAETI